MPNEATPNVHLIFDCDDTLINSTAVINALFNASSKKGVVSPTLIALCVKLINEGKLASITINTHQDLETIKQRLTGIDGLLKSNPTETLAWNVAQSLKDAIKAQTTKDIDVHVCLQSDIYPPLPTNENKHPEPHKLGHTASFLQKHQKNLTREICSFKDAIGEKVYIQSNLGEEKKSTQTAFVLAHIKKLQPNGIRHVLYFDDTEGNLEKNNLPTRESVNKCLVDDQKKLENLIPNDKHYTEKKRTLDNRMNILKNASCVNDDDIVFESYLFQHEGEEQRQVASTEKKIFNQKYHSHLHHRENLFFSVEDLCREYRPTTIQTKFFHKQDGLFTKYLLKREENYAWRDYLSTQAALFLRFFGYKTEKAKRQDFVADLENAFKSNDSRKLKEMITTGKKEFSPRAPRGKEGFNQSLCYVLDEFAKATESTTCKR